MITKCIKEVENFFCNLCALNEKKVKNDSQY